MNVGESTSGTYSMSSQNESLTVPAGETWKFTLVSTGTSSGTGGNNLFVGATDGSNTALIATGSGGSPPVGGNSNSARSITISGDNNDLALYDNFDTGITVFWCATRIS